MDIAPHTGNPKHYHTLFDETFEVVDGELFVGVGKTTKTMKVGDKITVPIGAVHFFKNRTDRPCRIKVTLEPGNTDFEDAMNIYYGLKRDGLVRKSGTPKNLADLSIFLKLNDSNMKGFGRVADFMFKCVANIAIKDGRLELLRNLYTL